MASPKGGNIFTLVGLILSIFVIILLIFVCYQFNAEKEKVLKDLQAANDEAKSAQQKYSKASRDLILLNEAVRGKNAAPADVETLKKNYLERAHLTLKGILEQEKFGGLSPKWSEELHNTAKGRIDDKPFTHMEQLFDVYERLVGSLVPELNRLRVARAEAETKWEQVREQAKKDRDDLQAQIGDLRNEKNRIENEKIAQATEADKKQRELLDKKDEVEKQLAKVQEDLFVTTSRYESMIDQLEERIQQMKDKRERSLADTDADGEVVYSDHRLGKAWIDIGRNDRLRRGLTFEVFQYVKGGKRKVKGMIEIKEVEDDHAICAVLEELDPADPIIKGDHVASPFFDKKKQMVFVLVGTDLTNDRYDRSQLIRRIQDFGGRVDDNVTIDTDFVVAIKDAEQSKDFAQAVQFGTIIMRESELLEFIGQ